MEPERRNSNVPDLNSAEAKFNLQQGRCFSCLKTFIDILNSFYLNTGKIISLCLNDLLSKYLSIVYYQTHMHLRTALFYVVMQLILSDVPKRLVRPIFSVKLKILDLLPRVKYVSLWTLEFGTNRLTRNVDHNTEHNWIKIK